MKKWIFFAALTLSAPAFSDGFYTGAHVGMSSVTVDSNINGVDVDMGAQGMRYGGYLGYEVEYGGHAFVALEAEFSAGNSKATQSSGAVRLEATRGNSYGVSALVGMPVGRKADVFGRFGLLNGHFEAEETDGSSTDNGDTRETGYMIGLGSRFLLSDRTRLRLDYRYIQYRDAGFDGGSEFAVNEHLFTIGVQLFF
ncbi:outer membrane protein [Endozoicomonas sp.]|uniref:outer membrane protein n=1 Tax=Endozoicomonas sp. TaxID=1892382 RepID=UPI0028844082|nr:outer membrane beta-barrel protein [Endozoicomonas sp.]